MITHLVRIIFLIAVLAITASYTFQDKVYKRGPQYVTLYLLIPVLSAAALIIVDMFWRRKRLHVLSGLFFGILAGLVIAYVLTLSVDLVVRTFPQLSDAPDYRAVVDDDGVVRTFPQSSDAPNYRAVVDDDGVVRIFPQLPDAPAVQLVKTLLGAAAVFLCVTIVLQTKDDFRFVIPYVEFSKQTKGARPLLLDTSAIIDGRIADISETRILESEVIVPRFVLQELQAIADSQDKLKRNRGRRGLDVLNSMQTAGTIDIRIVDAQVPDVEAAPDVDAKLVAMARHLDGRIITNDYNLNKIAQLRGVDVININDLANAVKPVVLPGEEVIVKVLRPGEEPGQGVGFLDDGTMVVAEQARDCIGKTITINVTSVLQTSAGRMIFGKLDADKTFSRQEQRARRRESGEQRPNRAPHDNQQQAPE